MVTDRSKIFDKEYIFWYCEVATNVRAFKTRTRKKAYLLTWPPVTKYR